MSQFRHLISTRECFLSVVKLAFVMSRSKNAVEEKIKCILFLSIIVIVIKTIKMLIWILCYLVQPLVSCYFYIHKPQELWKPKQN